MEISEEFLTQLFVVIEAIIDERAGDILGRNTLTEVVRSEGLKRELINVFVFGDSPSC